MKQRQWVRITAVFFALMIVLTIFSRAAASMTKARVVVTKADRQTISHEIRLNGTIEAKDYFMQYVPSGLMVKSVRVSPGQRVESGDVLFTVDTQKLQEKIEGIEAEIANVKKRDSLSISRAEKAYQDAASSADEEKARSYRACTEAVNAYNQYISTQANYDEASAMELKSAAEAAKDAYEAVTREQDKLIKAAADTLQQTKDDIELEQGAKQLEDSLKELEPYLQNEGQYLAEHPGMVGRVSVEAGAETAAGVAALIADSAGGARFVATFSEEYRKDITEASTVTLKGESLAGGEESYVASDVAVSEGNAPEPGALAEYTLSSDIPGDLYPVGSSVLVTVDNQSEQYDTCLPLPCLRQNGNYQYFIYVTEEQDTMFGKEMVAKEMPVTVLDKNERYAAVQEAVSQDVVVSASKDISDGSRVKISE